MVATDGKVKSAVDVATTIASISLACMPASFKAARAASVARTEVVSPSAAKWRRSMPERVRIHSSLVSIQLTNSALGTTRAGR